MTKISLIAIPAAEGKAGAMKEALAALVAAAEEEAGLEIYSAHQDGANPRLLLFELYTDADAFAVHGKSDAMKAAMGAVGANMGGKPEIPRMTPVVAKGIAL
ncbi:MAG: antibiotic biosynthesis monooxygenase [Acidimicrobiales bacterium]